MGITCSKINIEINIKNCTQQQLFVTLRVKKYTPQYKYIHTSATVSMCVCAVECKFNFQNYKLQRTFELYIYKFYNN